MSLRHSGSASILDLKSDFIKLITAEAFATTSQLALMVGEPSR